jgi:hypothetical protein
VIGTGCHPVITPALAVVLAHQHVAAGGGLAKPKIGN